MNLPWRQLRQRGILGMNSRNGDYIMTYNRRSLFPLVDDKRRTKALAIEAGIAVPELYGVIEIERQSRQLESIIGARQDFVIKPAHGSGGNGILVVTGRTNGRFRLADGTLATREELRHHISNILSGMYSLGGVPDSALVEYRVKFDPLFEAVSYQGVPDVRIIVFRSQPVMAMLRLPTRMSDGKANLHQGAIGAGIDLATGRTTNGVWLDRPVEHHPDTGASICDLAVPTWDRFLDLAVKCQRLVQLEYLGADIVLDETLGPLVLELNARPGLGIQIANRAGLLSRLKEIESSAQDPASGDERPVPRRLFVPEGGGGNSPSWVGGAIGSLIGVSQDAHYARSCNPDTPALSRTTQQKE
jgi:alpha-L-glutamate ligase-like protein